MLDGVRQLHHDARFVEEAAHIFVVLREIAAERFDDAQAVDVAHCVFLREEHLAHAAAPEGLQQQVGTKLSRKSLDTIHAAPRIEGLYLGSLIE
jgi:hypothetical protein